MIEHFSDPYLRDLERDVVLKIEERCREWAMKPDAFAHRFEAWFANFAERDKPLALKLFLHLDYFSEDKFDRRIADLSKPLGQHLYDTRRTFAHVLLVVPDERADSADRHAYVIAKAWRLPQAQVVTVSDLAEAPADRVLVFFNDTHGTGNQFVRDVTAKANLDRFRSVFIIALTIGEKAFKRFKSEIARATILPDRPTRSVGDLFTSNEVRRIRTLGNKVYPSHPMGYGDAGLLTAYHFQCPNNTLPLIWANGENNEVDGRAYPWTPLCPYQPKAKVGAPAPMVPPAETPDEALLDPPAWRWTAEERARIAARIALWGLTTSSSYRIAGEWFANFTPGERDVARDLFLATSYLDIGRVRDGIRRLGDQVMDNIRNAGGDSNDIVLATTGDHRNSVYHYVFDFLREWRMEVDQVRALSKLSPDAVIDKTLVLFYHTRQGGHFSRTMIGKQTYLERLRELDPRVTFFAAYTTTPAARADLNKLDRAELVDLTEVSGTVAERLPQHAAALTAIEDSLVPGRQRSHDEQLLVAYYFQCPTASSPLLWMEQPGGDGKRPWCPLFRNVRMGR